MITKEQRIEAITRPSRCYRHTSPNRSDKEGWPAVRFLATIAEHELPNAAGGASNAIS